MAILALFTATIQAQTEKSKETVSPKIFVVLDITVHDTIMYEQYRIKVEPIIKNITENIWFVLEVWHSTKTLTKKSFLAKEIGIRTG